MKKGLLAVAAVATLTLCLSSLVLAQGSETIVNDTDSGFAKSGIWIAGSYNPSTAHNYDYQFSATTTGTDQLAVASCSWTPDLATSGYYDVYVWYNQGGNRSTAAPYSIFYSGGTYNASVNQTINGSQWFKIGSSLPFASGTLGYVSLSNVTASGNIVIADAVKFTLVTVPEPSSILALLGGLAGLLALKKRR